MAIAVAIKAGTIDQLAAWIGGGSGRNMGVSLRSTEVAQALNPQNGLYTLIDRGAAATSARVIGSIRDVIAAALHGRQAARCSSAMSRPMSG